MENSQIFTPINQRYFNEVAADKLLSELEPKLLSKRKIEEQLKKEENAKAQKFGNFINAFFNNSNIYGDGIFSGLREKNGEFTKWGGECRGVSIKGENFKVFNEPIKNKEMDRFTIGRLYIFRSIVCVFAGFAEGKRDDYGYLFRMKLLPVSDEYFHIVLRYTVGIRELSDDLEMEDGYVEYFSRKYYKNNTYYNKCIKSESDVITFVGKDSNGSIKIPKFCLYQEFNYFDNLLKCGRDDTVFKLETEQYKFIEQIAKFLDFHYSSELKFSCKIKNLITLLHGLKYFEYTRFELIRNSVFAALISKVKDRSLICKIICIKIFVGEPNLFDQNIVRNTFLKSNMFSQSGEFEISTRGEKEKGVIKKIQRISTLCNVFLDSMNVPKTLKNKISDLIREIINIE